MAFEEATRHLLPADIRHDESPQKAGSVYRIEPVGDPSKAVRHVQRSLLKGHSGYTGSDEAAEACPQEDVEPLAMKTRW